MAQSRRSQTGFPRDWGFCPLEVALRVVDKQNSQPSTPDPWNPNSLIYRFLFNIDRNE